ncbi:putative 2-succinyl-6-hydroxy-2,4-cyclohexadiene-1-carboxylate synthase [Bacteroidota bacterium]|nr:putative 2-succinyl-6-hydroxy-2,4-cyclohexadiene-1-carboxylate synthase [Bacteroidota bacterium]
MKPPLILLHGAIGAASQFNSFADLLSQSFIIYTFDFDGHGQRAFNNRPFRIQHFAENLSEFIEEYHLQPADIFGYSMGGYVALYLAATRPEYIHRIYTLATKFDWNIETALKESAQLNAEKLKEKVPQFAHALQQRHLHGWEQNLKHTTELMIHLGNNPALDKTILKNIEAACMIAVGDADKMVSQSETENFASYISNAQFKVLHNTQHPLEKLNADLLKSELEEFFIV